MTDQFALASWWRTSPAVANGPSVAVGSNVVGPSPGVPSLGPVPRRWETRNGLAFGSAATFAPEPQPEARGVADGPNGRRSPPPPSGRAKNYCSVVNQSDWDRHPILGSAFVDEGRYLYHYTSASTASMIAESGSLRLSPLARLNDPREAMHRELAVMSVHDPRNPDGPETDELARAYAAHVRRERELVRVGCFVRDQDLRSVPDAKPMTRLDRRGFARSAMWTHYANGNCGVCLILDGAALERSASDALSQRCRAIQWGDVRYVEGFDPVILRSETADLIDRSAQSTHHVEEVLPSLLVKNRDWEREFERRIIVDGWTDGGPCSIPLANALVGLVLAVGFQSPDLALIAPLANMCPSLGDVAKLVFTANVLVPYPAQGVDGELHAWTDTDARRAEIFDPE